MLGVTHQALDNFIPLIAAGLSSFSVAKKNQNATAAPAAMKGSARARTVIAAPVKAEDRLLKVCASVSDKNNWINRHVRHWTGIKL